jgi:hypothetical protein
VQARVAAREHVSALRARLAGPARDDPARTFDERHQRLHVVGLQSRLDDHIDQAHRELRVAVAVPAEAHQPRPVGGERIGRALALAAEVARVGGGDGRSRDRRACARAHRASLARALPVRALARDAHERLAHERLVRDADDRTRTVVERDERRPVQLPEDEAAGAVDGIDHPRPRLAAGLLAVLLPEDAVAGELACDGGANGGFRAAVGLGHRVVCPAPRGLVRHRDRGAEMGQDRRPRRLGHGDGERGVARVRCVHARAGTMLNPASFSCASTSDGT